MVLQPAVVQDHKSVGGHRVQYLASPSFPIGKVGGHEGAKDMSCK